jgi:hypothetical protein
MRALLDVNALIALSDEDHPFNSVIRSWWDDHDGGWASCPITQNGFLRVVSQPSYANSMTIAEAFDVLDRATKQRTHEFWPDDLSLIDRSQIDRRYVVGPKQLTDIYLLALAAKKDGCLVTFDRSIPLAAVRGAEAHHLVVPRR